MIQVVDIKHETGVRETSPDQAGNLLNKIHIFVGARVMLTRNFWQAHGLVNGAQGHVFDLGWAPETDWHADTLRVIVAVFDRYSGPTFIPTDDGGVVVLVLPVKNKFLKGVVTCNNHTQFPLIISYTRTVHKSQSITVDKIVTDLSKCDIQLGLRYIALLLRIKTIEGLMLDAPFDRCHLSEASRSGTAALEEALFGSTDN